jgi:hypothetical protein
LQALLDRASVLVFQQQQQQQQPSSSSSSVGSLLVRPAELVKLIYSCTKLQQRRPDLQASAAAFLQDDLFACSPTELSR